jgi:hypothetical protein
MDGSGEVLQTTRFCIQNKRRKNGLEGGQIQLLVPGDTACFQCVPPLTVASGVDGSVDSAEGVGCGRQW